MLFLVWIHPVLLLLVVLALSRLGDGFTAPGLYNSGGKSSSVRKFTLRQAYLDELPRGPDDEDQDQSISEESGGQKPSGEESGTPLKPRVNEQFERQSYVGALSASKGPGNAEWKRTNSGNFMFTPSTAPLKGGTGAYLNNLSPGSNPPERTDSEPRSGKETAANQASGGQSFSGTVSPASRSTPTGTNKSWLGTMAGNFMFTGSSPSSRGGSGAYLGNLSSDSASKDPKKPSMGEKLKVNPAFEEQSYLGAISSSDEPDETMDKKISGGRMWTGNFVFPPTDKKLLTGSTGAYLGNLSPVSITTTRKNFGDSTASGYSYLGGFSTASDQQENGVGPESETLFPDGAATPSLPGEIQDKSPASFEEEDSVTPDSKSLSPGNAEPAEALSASEVQQGGPMAFSSDVAAPGDVSSSADVLQGEAMATTEQQGTAVQDSEIVWPANAPPTEGFTRADELATRSQATDSTAHQDFAAQKEEILLPADERVGESVPSSEEDRSGESVEQEDKIVRPDAIAPADEQVGESGFASADEQLSWSATTYGTEQQADVAEESESFLSDFMPTEQLGESSATYSSDQKGAVAKEDETVRPDAIAPADEQVGESGFSSEGFASADEQLSWSATTYGTEQQADVAEESESFLSDFMPTEQLGDSPATYSSEQKDAVTKEDEIVLTEATTREDDQLGDVVESFLSDIVPLEQLGESSATHSSEKQDTVAQEDDSALPDVVPLRDEQLAESVSSTDEQLDESQAAYSADPLDAVKQEDKTVLSDVTAPAGEQLGESVTSTEGFDSGDESFSGSLGPYSTVQQDEFRDRENMLSNTTPSEQTGESAATTYSAEKQAAHTEVDNAVLPESTDQAEGLSFSQVEQESSSKRTGEQSDRITPEIETTVPVEGYLPAEEDEGGSTTSAEEVVVPESTPPAEGVLPDEMQTSGATTGSHLDRPTEAKPNLLSTLEEESEGDPMAEEVSSDEATLLDSIGELEIGQGLEESSSAGTTTESAPSSQEESAANDSKSFPITAESDQPDLLLAVPESDDEESTSATQASQVKNVIVRAATDNSDTDKESMLERAADMDDRATIISISEATTEFSIDEDFSSDLGQIELGFGDAEETSDDDGRSTENKQGEPVHRSESVAPLTSSSSYEKTSPEAVEGSGLLVPEEVPRISGREAERPVATDDEPALETGRGLFFMEDRSGDELGPAREARMKSESLFFAAPIADQIGESEPISDEAPVSHESDMSESPESNEVAAALEKIDYMTETNAQARAGSDMSGASLDETISASVFSARNVGSDNSIYVSAREILRESKARAQRRLSRSAYEKEKAAEKIANLKSRMEAATRKVEKALESKLEQSQSLVDTEVERIIGLLKAEIDLEDEREVLVIGLIDSLEDSKEAMEKDTELEAAITEELQDVRSKQKTGSIASDLDSLLAKRGAAAAVTREIAKDLSEGLQELRSVLTEGRERRSRTETALQRVRRPETGTDMPYEWSDIEEMEKLLDDAADNATQAASRIRVLSQKVDEALVRKGRILGEPVPSSLALVARMSAAKEGARKVISVSKPELSRIEKFGDLQRKEPADLLSSFADSLGKTVLSASRLGFFGVQALVDTATLSSTMDSIDKSSGFSLGVDGTDSPGKGESSLSVSKKGIALKRAKSTIGAMGNAGSVFMGNIGKSRYSDKAGAALKETSEDLLSTFSVIAALTAKVVDLGIKKVEESSDETKRKKGAGSVGPLLDTQPVEMKEQVNDEVENERDN